MNRESFIELDSALHKLFAKNRRWSGSTCTATLITPAHIFTANLGDSRTLLVQKVPIPPFRAATIFEGDTEEEISNFVDPGVKFSTADHKYVNFFLIVHFAETLLNQGRKINFDRAEIINS